MLSAALIIIMTQSRRQCFDLDNYVCGVGIGKSYFAVYELYLEVKAGKNVVYQRHTTEWCFRPSEGHAFVFTDNQLTCFVKKLLCSLQQKSCNRSRIQKSMCGCSLVVVVLSVPSQSAIQPRKACTIGNEWLVRSRRQVLNPAVTQLIHRSKLRPRAISPPN